MGESTSFVWAADGGGEEAVRPILIWKMHEKHTDIIFATVVMIIFESQLKGLVLSLPKSGL